MPTTSSNPSFVKAIRFWIPVGVSLAATPILLCLGVFSAGAGHGTYFLASMLFPFTMLSAFPITTPFIVLAVIQFPVYGIILGVGNAKGKLIPTALVLLAIHGLGIGSLYASSYYARYNYWHDPTNQLIEAVRRDDVPTAKRMLDQGVDPNVHKPSGPSSLLGLACMDGHVEMAKLLIGEGADINYRDPRDGDTALFSAVLFGHEDIVQLLLEKGADINYADFRGQTPLFSAVRREQMVQLLLSKGADVTVKDREGFTVLERVKQWREDLIKRVERKPFLFQYTAEDRARDEKIISLLEAAAKDQKK